MTRVQVRNEDLVAGDTIDLLGRWVRIVAIRPYEGPLADVVFAIAETSGLPFSLEIGGHIDVLREVA